MTEEKKCPLYKKCGGCQLQNLSYAEQLKFKQRKVEKLLGEFAHVEPIIGMLNRIIIATRYRRRLPRRETER